jgi:hypothetical protein
MISADRIAHLANRRAPKLATLDYECVVEQSTLLKVEDQSGTGLVDFAVNAFEIFVEVLARATMTVPSQTRNMRGTNLVCLLAFAAGAGRFVAFDEGGAASPGEFDDDVIGRAGDFFLQARGVVVAVFLGRVPLGLVAVELFVGIHTNAVRADCCSVLVAIARQHKPTFRIDWSSRRSAACGHEENLATGYWLSVNQHLARDLDSLGRAGTAAGARGSRHC